MIDAQMLALGGTQVPEKLEELKRLDLVTALAPRAVPHRVMLRNQARFSAQQTAAFQRRFGLGVAQDGFEDGPSNSNRGHHGAERPTVQERLRTRLS